MAPLFRNPFSGEIRAGWRIAFFLLVAAILVAPIATLIEDILPKFGESFINGLLSMVGMTAALMITARVLERRPAVDYGLTGSVASWAAGILTSMAITVALIALLLVPAILGGWYTVGGHLQSEAAEAPFAMVFLTQVGRYLTGGFGEELFSRGFLIPVLAHAIMRGGRATPRDHWIAMGLSAALFSMLHLLSGGSTLLSFANLFLLGLLFGAAYLLTGRLSWAVGIHVGWNIGQNIVFGLPNGGKPSLSAIIALEPSPHVPQWLHGGQGGLEASLVGSITILVGLGLLFWWKRRRARETRQSLA